MTIPTTRRNLLGWSAAATAATAFSSVASSAASAPGAAQGGGGSRLVLDPAVVAETAQGRVRGYRMGDVRIFKGIPYASTTAAKRRFLPPAPPESWSGVRSSLAYGPLCPQGPRGGWRQDEQAFLFHWDDGFAGEDCLRLNVWSRMPGLGSKMPVMFWIHGGGYTAGSSQELPAYDGENMARNHGVVLVSVNHRLGPLGFLDLSEAGGDQYRHSGNAGMLDLVAALAWVRDNIAAFGGDPGNVTIFGQSGGGSKVTTLMGMPAAKGLFHKAIVQSGSFTLSSSSETARRFAAEVMREAGVGSDVGKLAEMPTDALIAAGNAVQARNMPAGFNIAAIGGPRIRLPGWSPTVDGDVLPEAPFSNGAPELSRHVPMIVGSTRDEFSLTAADLTDAQVLQRMERIDAGRRGPALSAFKAAFPRLTPGELVRVMSGSSLRTASLDQAAAKARAGGAPAYNYYFTFPCQTLNWGAFHCFDLAFCFDNVKRWETATGDTDAARGLGRTMSAAWARFAATGNPSQPGLTWDRFDPATVPTMVFDAQSRVERDPAGDARRMLG